MISINKFVTLDVEADGCAASVNKQLFPETPHWDPNSRLWCVTFTEQVANSYKYKSHTLVCKLPNEPRYIGSIGGRDIFGAYHETASKVPQQLTINTEFNCIPNVQITEYTDYTLFLVAILNEFAKYNNAWIYSKGYGSYNFDKWILEKEISKYSVGSQIILPILTYNPTEWINTAPQVKRGQYIPNQEYMVNGIRHNIEDSEQLYYCVLNGMGV